MAYIYLSDGGPEAEDYDSNYYQLDDITMDGELEIKSYVSNIIDKSKVIRGDSGEKRNNDIKSLHGSLGLVIFLLCQFLIIYIAF